MHEPTVIDLGIVVKYNLSDASDVRFQHVLKHNTMKSYYRRPVFSTMRDTWFKHQRNVFLLIINAFLLLIFIKFSSCNPEPQDGGSFEPTPSLDYDRNMISSLHIVPPLLTCGSAVTVQGFIPNAKIRIYFDGTLVREDILLDPDFGTIDVPLMKKGQMVTATQEFDGKESVHSKPEKVKDHTEAYPAGLPRPEFPFLPLYDCGRATAVDQLPPGGTVRVIMRHPAGVGPGTTVATADGVAVLESMLVAPAFQSWLYVTAQSQLCADVSPLSERHDVVPPVIQLPTPEVSGIYEGGSILTVHKLVNGANVVIKRAGNVIGGSPAPGPHVKFFLSRAVSNQDVLEITQVLCGRTSPPTTISVRPCSALPPPKIMAPRKGDDVIYPTSYEAGSRIRIFSGGIEIGDGGGAMVRLMRPLLDNEKIIVVQTLGNCTASTSYVVEVGRGLEDPLQSGDCGKIVSFEYGDANDPLQRTTDVLPYYNLNFPYPGPRPPLDSVPLHGIVRYPEGPGPFPLVFIVHGDSPFTSPPYEGYTYLQDLLAKHCMIAVSIDVVGLSLFGGILEIDSRAIVLLRHLQLWREWNRDPQHPLYGKVDMNRIGLAGHGIAGEAILAAEVLNRQVHNPADPLHDFNFNIRALCALAPFDAGSDFPLTTLNGGADYYVMQGSHDGGASDFAGHRAYDRAFPVNGSASNFKGMLFVRGANHNMWNTAFPPVDQTQVARPVQFISSGDQQQLAKLYITSFFLASLKGWKSYRYFLNGEVTFNSLPPGVTSVFQYQDPERIFLNHYEEDDDLKTGSFPGVINIPQGQFETYSDYNFWEPGPNNFLFEQTDGLLVAWKNPESAVIRIQLPRELQTDNPYEFFAFRAGQSAEQSASLNALNNAQDMSVQLQFVGATGPELKVSDYATLRFPVKVNKGLAGGGTKSVMQTVRIPWKDLIGSVPYNVKVTEILLKFNKRNTGKLVIDEIQFTE